MPARPGRIKTRDGDGFCDRTGEGLATQGGLPVVMRGDSLQRRVHSARLLGVSPRIARLVLSLVMLTACDSRASRDSVPAARTDSLIAAPEGDSVESTSGASGGAGLSPDELLRRARPLTAEEAEELGIEPDTSIHLEHPQGWDTLR